MADVNKLTHSKLCARPHARSFRRATDHSGTSLRTHFQPGATIVQVQGAVEASNATRLSDYVDDLASATRPLILDLRGVNSFSGDGFHALVRIAEKLQRTGKRWAVVTSEAIDRLLRTTDSKYRLPIAASVQEALQHLTSPDPSWSLPNRITTREVTRC